MASSQNPPYRSPGLPAGRPVLEELALEIRLMSSFGALFTHAVAERVGMHTTDIQTVDLLNVLGPMTAGQLAEQTGLTSGATTRLIDRLENAGLVRRRADPSDRRRVIIEPRIENLAEIAALFVPVGAALAQLWSTFSDEELQVVLRLCRESTAIVSRENARLRHETS